jgi:hypothetical protein
MSISLQKKALLVAFASILFVYICLLFTLHQSVIREETSTGPKKVNAITSLIEQFSDRKSIRKWGCNRNESPFIFVHNGKAGGGSIRVRFALAAENYTRSKWWAIKDDNHYYPIQTNSGIARGKYCNSGVRHYRIFEAKRIKNTAFEGAVKCNATTPLGEIIGCPDYSEHCPGCTNASDLGCHTVYMGHNNLGEEMHWLPAPYLQAWWKQNWASRFNSIPIEDGFKSLTPGSTDPMWCPEKNRTRVESARVKQKFVYRLPELYDCSPNISQTMDERFQRSWKALAADHANYGPIYASLPLHRAILFREPFSWVMSHFFWHKHYYKKMKCDDIKQVASYNIEDFESSGPIYQTCLSLLLQICGSNCAHRYELGAITLEEIERQAESNLRHGFSVVGLLHETDTFFDMLTK